MHSIEIEAGLVCLRRTSRDAQVHSDSSKRQDVESDLVGRAVAEAVCCEADCMEDIAGAEIVGFAEEGRVAASHALALTPRAAADLQHGGLAEGA